MQDLSIRLIAQADRRLVNAVIKELEAYNRRRAPQLEFDEIFGVAHRRNLLLGGVLAFSYGGWMFLDVLWVHDDVRGQGVGAELLRQAEVEAVRRGCHSAHTDTFTFQALPFYEKQGYEIFASLDGYEGGQSRYYLKKRLT